ncbi:hypothetical protein ACWDRB_67005 [Nonomuraea sp. NPDC003707]
MMAIDDQRRVLVEWRAPYADGLRLEQEWITLDYIAAGGLGYGTALTVAATQGATVDRALVYGMGLDPHSLYAAMSRDREMVRLYLPRELLESDADRARAASRTAMRWSCSARWPPTPPPCAAIAPTAW